MTAREYPQQDYSRPAEAIEVMLVRHGASQAAVDGQAFELLEGQADPALAPAGERQAEAVARLGELDGGAFRIAVAQRDPRVTEVFAQQRWDVIPGAETMEAFAARTSAGLARMIDGLQSGATVAAVLHGGVIGELCRQASGSRPFAFMHADNGSLTRLVVLPDGRRWVRTFNEGAHLR